MDALPIDALRARFDRLAVEFGWSTAALTEAKQRRSSQAETTVPTTARSSFEGTPSTCTAPTGSPEASPTVLRPLTALCSPSMAILTATVTVRKKRSRRVLVWPSGSPANSSDENAKCTESPLPSPERPPAASMSPIATPLAAPPACDVESDGDDVIIGTLIPRHGGRATAPPTAGAAAAVGSRGASPQPAPTPQRGDHVPPRGPATTGRLRKLAQSDGASPGSPIAVGYNAAAGSPSTASPSPSSGASKAAHVFPPTSAEKGGSRVSDASAEGSEEDDVLGSGTEEEGDDEEGDRGSLADFIVASDEDEEEGSSTGGGDGGAAPALSDDDAGGPDEEADEEEADDASIDSESLERPQRGLTIAGSGGAGAPPPGMRPPPAPRQQQQMQPKVQRREAALLPELLLEDGRPHPVTGRVVVLEEEVTHRGYRPRAAPVAGGGAGGGRGSSQQQQPHRGRGGGPPPSPAAAARGVTYLQSASHRESATAALFAEYNAEVFRSALPPDMLIEWGPRLTRTAGLTYTRSELAAAAGGGVRRVARIVLSTKVLVTHWTLAQTLLHEMCHVAAWLVDGCSRPPHGPAFQRWAARATAAYPFRAVTTCHSYDVPCKYRWACTGGGGHSSSSAAAHRRGGCGATIGRHSKSIDVERQRCARCGGRLEYLGTFHVDGTPARRPRAPAGSSARAMGSGAVAAAAAAAAPPTPSFTSSSQQAGWGEHRLSFGGSDDESPPRTGSPDAAAPPRHRWSRLGLEEEGEAEEEEEGSDVGSEAAPPAPHTQAVAAAAPQAAASSSSSSSGAAASAASAPVSASASVDLTGEASEEEEEDVVIATRGPALTPARSRGPVVVVIDD